MILDNVGRNRDAIEFSFALRDSGCSIRGLGGSIICMHMNDIVYRSYCQFSLLRCQSGEMNKITACIMRKRTTRTTMPSVIKMDSSHD